MRLFAILSLALAVSLAGLKTSGADDAISKLMRDQSEGLPVAPSKPMPEQIAGPSIGSAPQGPLPIVMSARIGEHDDRTRLVIELSDPVNLRAFTLNNPDRVVVDMPEVT